MAKAHIQQSAQHVHDTAITVMASMWQRMGRADWLIATCTCLLAAL